jgi:hypothetical protein
MAGQGGSAATRQTVVTIVGDEFHINGAPTYQGRTWRTSSGQEHRVQGLLMNARLVQGTFDDLNPSTRGQWAYPDTGRWDPDRNTTEFLQAMAAWRAHGLLSFTLNLQGGCPYGYCRSQPWVNSAFAPDGSLRPEFMTRLARILDRADELGMVAMLGYFYFGQDERLSDEAAVVRAVDQATNWILERGYRNVLVEVNNECNVSYDHLILRCDRVHELIERVRRTAPAGRRLYASTSLGGNTVPPASVVAASDYVLLHGNGVTRPERIAEMIAEVRRMPAYRPKPIVNNEDDQPWRVAAQGWREEGNNFVEAVKHYASWGYFDFRLEPEHQDYNAGFQGVPVNWQISSPRKQQFFDLMATITGSPGTPKVAIRWEPVAGGMEVTADRDLDASRRPRLEVILNNEVVVRATTLPFRGTVDSVPTGPHAVKARLTYDAGGHDVVVESPLYRNPWWPYGGPPRTTTP